MTTMNKLSGSKIAQVLHDAEVAIRTVAQERDQALQKVARLERHDEAAKLASVMHEKGLYIDVPHDQLTLDLEKKAESGELPIIGRAVDMIAPNMGLNTASLSSDESKTAGVTDLERYIFGAIG